MFSTIGFHESVDAAGAQQDLTPALADAIVRTQGDRIYVPELTQLVLAAAGVGSGGNGTARLETPELLKMGRHYIAPVNGANDGNVEPDSPHAVEDLRAMPLALVKGEGILGTVHSNTTAAALQWIIAWLADGPIAPVAMPHFTTRLTGTTTLVASTWTLCQLTPDENLPRGRYAIVGMRVLSATGIAARLVLAGQGARPGVLCVDAVTDLQWPGFRHGGMGVFGEWEDTDAIQVEVLANAGDTAQTVWLDLAPIRLGPG